MVEQRGKRLGVYEKILVGIIVIGLSIMVWSPETVVSVFGEWGYRHLVSTDKKVAMINNRLADPDYPLLIAPGSAWSAGVYYPEELLLCKAVSPPEFVLVDLQDENESAVTWHGSDTFSYPVKGYPITITVHVVEVTGNGEARIRVFAEKTVKNTGD